MKINWQYKTEYCKPFSEAITELLNRQGMDGWEAWHMDLQVVSTVYFKRRVSLDES